jgi:DNA-binding HxlR family transcriptional regulator
MRNTPTEMWIRIDAVLQTGPRFFNEICRLTNAPNPPVVSRTLTRMERRGEVTRRVLTEERPPRVEYSLTEKDA